MAKKKEEWGAAETGEPRCVITSDPAPTYTLRASDPQDLALLQLALLAIEAHPLYGADSRLRLKGQTMAAALREFEVYVERRKS